MAMAISAGSRDPMFRPTGRCTRSMSFRDTPISCRGLDVRRRVPGIAHHADPPGFAGQQVAQHRPQFGPVMVGDHDISGEVQIVGRRSHLRPPDLGRSRTPGVGLQQHDPETAIRAVVQQEFGDR